MCDFYRKIVADLGAESMSDLSSECKPKVSVSISDVFDRSILQ
jgi:hypothetical protein